jgi:hypothetical protein
MPHDFQPDAKRKGRNRYVDSWTDGQWRLIPLPFATESLRQVLDWGAHPDAAPYTHREIAHWCDRMHMQFLDTDEAPDMEAAIRIAADVDCQWDLFLANSYTLDQLRQLDFSAVRLPTEWFLDWQRQLEITEPDAAPNSRPPCQLPTSPEIQTPDSLRTPPSGGCG